MFDPKDLVVSDKFVKLSDIVVTNTSDLKLVNSVINNHSNISPIVFVKVDLVNAFLKNLNIDKKIILISHHGDLRVTDKTPLHSHKQHANPFLINDNIIHWFACNLTYKNNKFTALPVGLEREMFFFGTNKHTEMCLAYSKTKEKTAYLNFNPLTDQFGIRQKLYDIFSNKKWVTSVRGKNGIHYSKYIKNLANHQFCFCPVGNTVGFNDQDGGASSIRFWECQYLGVIPIVKNTSITSFFSDLPMCVIDNWEDVTFDFLQNEFTRLKTQSFNFEKLKFSYWENLINSYKIKK